MDIHCDQVVKWRGGEIYTEGMPELKTFGERVAFLLKRRRMADQDMSSQKELAAAMGVSPQFLNALLNGRRRPNVEHLISAAAALETSVSFLALTSNDPSPEAVASDPNSYMSDEADEAAQLVDSMSAELRGIALDVLRVLAMHDTEGEGEGAPAPGTGGRLILGKLVSNLKKSTERGRVPGSPLK
jgi:transcriptional regulator with XRE-family HTH domain